MGNSWMVMCVLVPCVHTQVAFASNRTFCDIAVDSATHTQKDAPVKYSSKKLLSTAEYIVA